MDRVAMQVESLRWLATIAGSFVERLASVIRYSLAAPGIRAIDAEGSADAPFLARSSWSRSQETARCLQSGRAPGGPGRW